MPVLKLDFSNLPFDNKEALVRSIQQMIIQIADNHNIVLKDWEIQNQLGLLIEKMASGDYIYGAPEGTKNMKKKVSVIIDE